MTNPYGTAKPMQPKPKPVELYADAVFSDKKKTQKYTQWVLRVIISRPGQPPKEIRKVIRSQHGGSVSPQMVDGCIKRLRERGMIRGEKIGHHGVDNNCRTTGWWVVPPVENDRPFKFQDAGGGEISKAKGGGIFDQDVRALDGCDDNMNG